MTNCPKCNSNDLQQIENNYYCMSCDFDDLPKLQGTQTNTCLKCKSSNIQQFNSNSYFCNDCYWNNLPEPSEEMLKDVFTSQTNIKELPLILITSGGGNFQVYSPDTPPYKMLYKLFFKVNIGEDLPKESVEFITKQDINLEQLVREGYVEPPGI